MPRKSWKHLGGSVRISADEIKQAMIDPVGVWEKFLDEKRKELGMHPRRKPHAKS